MHIARVRVDPETGRVEPLRYVVVQDVGRAINPATVEEQIHGGGAQGVGWAMYEEIVHDESGTPITASFMDYTVPKARQIPELEAVLVEVPSPIGPFGAKPVGEPPVIPGGAAIANAVAAASGARVTELPLTPERVRRAMDAAATATACARVRSTSRSAEKRVFACALDWPGWCRSGRDRGRGARGAARRTRRAIAVVDALSSSCRPPLEDLRSSSGCQARRPPTSAFPAPIAERDAERLTPAHSADACGAGAAPPGTSSTTSWPARRPSCAKARAAAAATATRSSTTSCGAEVGYARQLGLQAAGSPRSATRRPSPISRARSSGRAASNASSRREAGPCATPPAASPGTCSTTPGRSRTARQLAT